ncbi:transposase [Escherichia coli]|nr:transposase [Escherichia coli]
MRPSKRTVRFETQPGYHLSATPGKKLIWWLPDNSAPGLTAASLNHAEYQRRALPIKRETESCGDDPKQHDNQ